MAWCNLCKEMSTMIGFQRKQQQPQLTELPINFCVKAKILKLIKKFPWKGLHTVHTGQPHISKGKWAFLLNSGNVWSPLASLTDSICQAAVFPFDHGVSNKLDAVVFEFNRWCFVQPAVCLISVWLKRKEYFEDKFPNTGLLCSTTDGGFQSLSLINRADKEFLENRGVVC